MSDQSAAEFDLCGPLPTGVTVLEASAGTGKTYTIAALTARFIAEGRPLRELLLVTFTRVATGELRERVRERLVSTEQELGRILAGAPPVVDDPLVTLLASADDAEVELRRRRLADSIANFDAATIATTHGFCQEVLAELGTLGDQEPDVTFTETVDDLRDEVVDDLYVRRFSSHGDPPFDRAEAGRIARIAIENPTAIVHPQDAKRDSIQAMRQRLAVAARRELERRKRGLALMTYDDLLTRLRDALAGPNGDAAGARLRARYRIVLIDEFQDTDPVQWEIVERAFGADNVTLVLIADPKQAIYAFRGADVYAYLAAARSASSRATLRGNRRSDQPLINAYDALFGGVKLGHPEIPYRTVRATSAHQRARLLDSPSPHALRVRIVNRQDPGVELTAAGYASAPSTREYVAKDLAADLVALLSSRACIEHRDQGDAAAGTEPVRPGDVAVLVRSHVNAALVQAELGAAGIPAVINGAGSVFGTRAALDWLRVLEALERPAASARARSAALTPLLGWSAEQVAMAGEDELEQLHQRLHTWARVLRLRGVAALAQTIAEAEHVPRRVLALRDGERELTDLQHIAQLLHGAASTERLGTAALTSWLRQRIAAAITEGNHDELTRRLESDADAVQVLTIHRSKGLEFPIVYCPFMWEPAPEVRSGEPVYFHDGDRGDARAIDVGLFGAEFNRHKDQYVREQRGEELRLLYVALTRAKHQATIWWAGAYRSGHSPIGRLLFCRDEEGNVAALGGKTPLDQAVVTRLEELAAGSGGAIGVEPAVLRAPVSWSGSVGVPADLATARFDRRLDARWRRTSYSDITAAAHELLVASEPEGQVLTDEPASAEPVGVPAGFPQREDAPGVPSLLGAMPMGARVGTFVHSVLQASDFAASDLALEVDATIESELARYRVEIGDPDVVTAGLVAAIETPLGARAGGLRLRDVERTSRLDELPFELPLVGGDEPTGRLTVAAIADVLREGLSEGDPLRGYAERLADPALRRDVRGFLTGSIDLVLRVRDDVGHARFAIVDYKTNWLAGLDEPLTAWHYRPAALVAEMERAHYGLQALLYAAALHRFLRWRVPGYSAERDFAGVHYLFLRGMVGAQTPVIDTGRCGVFSWHPPGAVVERLSDVLDGAPA